MLHYDLAIVGAGIVGLANAWAAAKRNLRVIVFERDIAAVGASVRNFGMVWPIGQTAGQQFELALRSRTLWLHLADEAKVWVNACGSLHLARQTDERAVIEEFLESDPRASGSGLRWLDVKEIKKLSPAANPDGLIGGMYSPFELCVNPPAAIRGLTHWLMQKYPIDFHFKTTVTSVSDQTLTTAAQQQFTAEQIMICSGADFETLFPSVYSDAKLKKCKLQMLATGSQPGNWKLGPHLAGGLTLRHYRAFESCATLPALRERIAHENPLLDSYGIHVMASQNEVGEVILGDSHVYNEAITPFDSSEIDNLILAELQQLIRLPDFQIQRRWHGVYAKHPTDAVFTAAPQPNCTIMTATGGAGMTLAFGYAEEYWERQL